MSVSRQPRLHPDAPIDLEAQPAQEADGLAELHVHAEVAHDLEHEAVGVAQGDVVVVRERRRRVLRRRVPGDLKRREELRMLLGIDPIANAGRDGELVSAREVLLEAEAQVDEDVMTGAG